MGRHRSDVNHMASTDHHGPDFRTDRTDFSRPEMIVVPVLAFPVDRLSEVRGPDSSSRSGDTAGHRMAGSGSAPPAVGRGPPRR